MANVKRKTTNKWDKGITTSNRDKSADTISAAQMVKGFDIYKNPNKLIPMQSWESFTTTDEKAYGIRAMGGSGSTMYGLGSGLTNWYGADWNYRIRVDIQSNLYTASGVPLRLDMSLLPNDFWSHVNSDMSDVRITGSDGVTGYGLYTENVNTVSKTGDMWIDGNMVSANGTTTTIQTQSGSGVSATPKNADNTNYAFAFPVTLTGQTFNRLRLSLLRTGTPSNVTVKLYSDTAGAPNVSVATLGTIESQFVNTFATAQDYYLNFTDITLTGSYWIVAYSTTSDVSNYFSYNYATTGSTTILRATNVGLTTWANVSTIATLNYSLYNYTDTVSKYFYIYYGNSTATVVPYGVPTVPYVQGGRLPFTRSSMRYAYTFGDSIPNNHYYTNNETGETEAFTSDPTYVSGYFGKAIRTFSTQFSPTSSDNLLLSTSVTISFMLYCTAWEAVTLVESSQGDYYVKLTAAGKIEFFVDGTVANTINTSTQTIPLNSWVQIDCTFNDDADIYINAIKENFNINDGNYDRASDTHNSPVVNTGNNCTISQVYGFSSVLTEEKIRTKFYNITKSNFFTVGSETAKSSVALQYGGVQMYAKNITSGDWYELLEGGRPVKSTTYYPVNSFIDDTATYFVVSTSPENAGFCYLAEKDFQTVVEPTSLTLALFAPNSRHIAIQSEIATGNLTQYYNFGTSAVGSFTSVSAYSALSTVVSLVSWRTYLAIASNYRNKGYIELWDLAVSTPIEKINIGTGTIRTLGTAGDTLFAVVDNFIDDSTKSTYKPTMEIRKYVGNGETKKTHVLEIPVNIPTTSYTDDWDFAVSPFKFQRNTQTLFYARLPKDDTATTFNEGFWAVGKNSEGELALTLEIDTEGLGMPENVFSFAQQVFFITKDGGIFRLTDNTYDNVALYTTLKMNEGSTEIEKKLIGVEIVTEPLESGQTVSLYFKKNGDTDRTKIFDMTGEGEISYETTYDINEDNLPHYQEIEFDIESTGGKSAVLEFNYKYEYLSNVV